MYDLNNDPIVNRKLSKSLKAYFHDEFRNNSISPYSLSSINNPNNIMLIYNGDYGLFNTIER